MLMSLGEGNTSVTFWLTLQGRSQKARTEATPLRCEFIRFTCAASSEEQKTSGRVSALVRKCHDRDPQQDTGDAHYTGETDEVISRQINLSTKLLGCFCTRVKPSYVSDPQHL